MQQGRFQRSLLSPTVEPIPCSSDRASHRLVGALKSQKWPLQPGSWLFFHGHQTVAKLSDDERKRLKVTDERGSSSAGVKAEADVPTGRWLTLLPASTSICVLFLGKTHVCYFRTLVTAGAFSSSDVWSQNPPPKNKKTQLQLGLITSNVFLMWGRCLCSSTAFFTVASLFHIYSSLIKSYPQAWNRRWVLRYAPLCHYPPISFFLLQDNFVSFSLIPSNLLLLCGFPARIHLCCQQPLQQLPWPSSGSEQLARMIYSR